MNPLLKNGLILSAVFLFLGAAFHIALLFMDPKWTEFAGAPPEVVQSLRDGTLLAPVICTIIALLVTVMGVYLLSLAGVIRRLPLLRLGGAMIGVIFTVRGLMILPYLGQLGTNSDFARFHILMSLLILLTGIFALWGARVYKAPPLGS